MFGLGITEFVVLGAVGFLYVLPLLAGGTLLKAALGLPKWYALVWVVPIVNLIMLVVWGFQAHQLIARREGLADLNE